MQRSDLVQQNEKEMADLLAQKEEFTRDFEMQWEEHGQQLLKECQKEINAL